MNIIINNIKIWKDTQDLVNKNKLFAPSSVKFKNIDIETFPIVKTTDVNVIDIDMVDAGIILKESKFKPVILNLCHTDKPGGLVNSGALNQEEDLFRRSNYFSTLEQKLYPIQDCETVYSRSVLVFRDNSQNEYKILTKPTFVDFIATTAIKNKDMDKNKLKNLFKIAYSMGNDAVVLNDRVCPKVFKEVIREFKGRFRVIVFAIKNNESDKFKEFKDIIEHS
jgi:uncharacterized protein (TIGR02452 family)